jgi:hypothetical protein
MNVGRSVCSVLCAELAARLVYSLVLEKIASNKIVFLPLPPFLLFVNMM